MGWLKDLRERRPVFGELVKQSIDQPLHILMTVGSVWAIGAIALVSLSSLLIAMIAGGTLTALWVALREYFQWPSSRWWDPPLDWAFETAGIILGVWSLGPVVGKIIALLS